MDREEFVYVGDGGQRRAVPGSVAYARMDPIYFGLKTVTGDRKDLLVDSM